MSDNIIAVDCEMVGVGRSGSESMLARVSLVNKAGICIYDKFVKPQQEVKNYRTHVSGIKKHHLDGGEEFSKVQEEVAEKLRGRILVGHSLEYDMEALKLSHPTRNTRDTALYEPFIRMNGGKTPSLKFLARKVLSKVIQQGPHSSIEDARVNMEIYCAVANTWETKYSDI